MQPTDPIADDFDDDLELDLEPLLTARDLVRITGFSLRQLRRIPALWRRVKDPTGSGKAVDLRISRADYRAWWMSLGRRGACEGEEVAA